MAHVKVSCKKPVVYTLPVYVVSVAGPNLMGGRDWLSQLNITVKLVKMVEIFFCKSMNICLTVIHWEGCKVKKLTCELKRTCNPSFVRHDQSLILKKKVGEELDRFQQQG